MKALRFEVCMPARFTGQGKVPARLCSDKGVGPATMAPGRAGKQAHAGSGYWGCLVDLPPSPLLQGLSEPVRSQENRVLRVVFSYG